MISATNIDRDHTRTLGNASGRFMDVYEYHFFKIKRGIFRENYTRTIPLLLMLFSAIYSTLFEYNPVLVLL